MALEIKVLYWDRHEKVVGFNWFMGYKLLNLIIKSPMTIQVYRLCVFTF